MIYQFPQLPSETGKQLGSVQFCQHPGPSPLSREQKEPSQRFLCTSLIKIKENQNQMLNFLRKDILPLVLPTCNHERKVNGTVPFPLEVLFQFVLSMQNLFSLSLIPPLFASPLTGSTSIQQKRKSVIQKFS